MSMHLVGPWLTTTGKRKGPRKFRTAEAAQRARQCAEDWENLKKRWDVDTTKKSTPAALSSQPAPFRRDTGPRIPSVDSGGAGSCTVQPAKVYTGDAMLGIATMHKSNMVPVFSEREAVFISKMRRG